MPKILATVSLALMLALGYGLFSVNGTLNDRLARVETTIRETQSEREESQQARAESEKKVNEMLADLDVMKKHFGMTSVELNHERQLTQTLRKQQEKVSKEFASQLAAKANSSDVDGLRQEATSKIAEVQQDSNTKIGSVSGEVSGIKQDLLATRDDLGRQIVEVKGLSERIAKNSSELSELRKKGDRDYFEFDIRRNSKQQFNQVADLRLALLKTDPKKHKYNMAIQVDDNRLEKRDRTVNEPVQFLVGHDHARYEVVVNSVEKDRVSGYVSTPKDIVASGESPKFRLQ